jgi:hypothetical protein
MEEWSYSSVILELDPVRFTGRQLAHGTHWVDHRARLGALQQKQNLLPLPGIEFQLSKAVAHRYTN